MRASKDSYIRFDVMTRMLSVVDVDRYSTAPDVGPTEVHIAKVITNASSVISVVTDDTPTQAINGTRIVASSIPSRAYATGSIGTRAIETGAVVAESLSAGAVTTRAVATASIGPAHVISTERKSGMFANAQFSIASRG